VYNPRHLIGVARQGLADMVPALVRAFNKRRDDDRLDRVFGRAPRAAVAAIIAAGILIGSVLEALFPDNLLTRHVHLPAALLALAWATMIRSYLFGSGEARRHDFPWLAASLIPAAIVLVALSFLSRVFGGGIETIPDAPGWTLIGGICDALADSIGVAAGLTIAVAALCFSKDWIKALRDLAIQLLIFKLLVFVTVLVFIELGIVGPVLSAIVRGITGIHLPEWLGDLADQLSHAALITTIYLAIIGATWTVCYRSFGRLLECGEADVLEEIKAMGNPPEKLARRAARKTEAANHQAPADPMSESRETEVSTKPHAAKESKL